MRELGAWVSMVDSGILLEGTHHAREFWRFVIGLSMQQLKGRNSEITDEKEGNTKRKNLLRNPPTPNYQLLQQQCSR